MEREYGFEVFSILVGERNLLESADSGVWLAGEILEALPSALGVEKLRMGHEVARVFMPQDYRAMPEAGFHRFFLFSFYKDLGIAGALCGSLLLGLLSASAYRLAHRKARAKRALWPLMVYLPVAVFAELSVNGVIAYAIIHIALASGVVWAIARFATLRVVH